MSGVNGGHMFPADFPIEVRDFTQRSVCCRLVLFCVLGLAGQEGVNKLFLNTRNRGSGVRPTVGLIELLNAKLAAIFCCSAGCTR